VNPELVTLDPRLFMWLVADELEPVAGWEADPPRAELRCDPALVARLALVARPIGHTARRFVAGCPVIHHPSGRPIAVAEGSAWIAVRSDLPPGALESSGSHVPRLSEHGWVELDPWAPDTAFARTIDLVRAHVVRAYENAEHRV
jgi:hypothetical protein